MCDNLLLADQFRARLAQATQDVDVALEQVRNIKSTILAQMTAEASAAGLSDNEPTPDEVAKAIETIRKHNANTDRDIYVAQEEYMNLMMAKKAIQRVRELHIKESVIAEFCEECFGKYPCPTIKALDGEQS